MNRDAVLRIAGEIEAMAHDGFISRPGSSEVGSSLMLVIAAELRAAVAAAPEALVRWHPKHGYNWTSIHFGDVWEAIEGWHDVPLYR